MKRKASAVRSRKRTPAYRHPGNYFVPVVEKAKHSVISLKANHRAGLNRRPSLQSFLIPFLYPDEEEESISESMGTGFIIHPAGYILTSEHVIHQADDIRVKLYNGKQYSAKIVLRDEERDLGVIKIQPDHPLRPLPLGSSAQSKVGELVISIGNPLGLDHTITTGVISAKNRKIRFSNSSKNYEEVIQTDCAINPGNSGGPLINLNGRVIGMNAFVVKDNQGLGFAIGIDSIKRRIGNYLPL